MQSFDNNIIIGGDFNVDLSRDNHNHNLLLNFMLQNNLARADSSSNIQLTYRTDDHSVNILARSCSHFNRLLPIDAFLRMRARMSLRAVDAFLRQLRSFMLNDGYFPEDYVTLTIFLSTRNHNHQGIYFRSKQYKYP